MLMALTSSALALCFAGGFSYDTTPVAMSQPAVKHAGTAIHQSERARAPDSLVSRRFYDDTSDLARPSARLGGYRLAPRALARSTLPSPADAADLVRGARPVGSALKGDVFHRSATWAVDDIASNGSVYRYVGGDGAQRTLIQSPGELNGIAGRFEWIVDDAGNLTHQMFVKGGSINGVPIRP